MLVPVWYTAHTRSPHSMLKTERRGMEGMVGGRRMEGVGGGRVEGRVRTQHFIRNCAALGPYSRTMNRALCNF